ncbi:glycosyl transferase [Paraferrimonas sp. SM1919]|uniref:glycosyl transferase n=1 Tax=Paraferrimonas sp. SM1919 TaxID=2662263 RepID=UPI0013D796A7|nr:glycosyl transferase [Paraferrimonas sp. SM1919]
MSDFHQSGSVTTLHNLETHSLEEMEYELNHFSRFRPMGLILPSLFSELEGPALKHIVKELEQADYLNQIVIGLDKADFEQYQYANEFFSSLPQEHAILWNDGPRLRAIDRELAKYDLAPKEAGKGRNVWYCMGYMLATGKAEAIALHDCDITTYDRSMLAKLLYPVAHPQFQFEFCKGYYARVADNKINGRVSRLLVTPLLRALQKVLGHHDYLEFLDSFRYPLAGEFSFRKDVLTDIRIPSDWGLEIGVLSEMYRNYSSNRICQADIAKHYDHKHQDLSLEDKTKGLSKMSIDISKAIFRKLATCGVTIDSETFRTIKACYFRIALDFVESYQKDALMNGLQLDVHQEEKAVEMFAQNILQAGQIFLDNPAERPFIPSWSRVQAAIPDIFDRLAEAVELDAKELRGKLSESA